MKPSTLLKKSYKKISNNWKNYRKQKKTILKNFKKTTTRAKKINALIFKIKLNNKNAWIFHQDKKFEIKESKKGIKKTRRTFKEKYVEYHKLNDTVDIVKYINSVFNKRKKPIFVSINMKFRVIEEGQKPLIKYYGDAYSEEGWRRLVEYLPKANTTVKEHLFAKADKNLEKYGVLGAEYISTSLAFSYYIEE